MKNDLRFCIDYVRPTRPFMDNGSLNVRHFRALSKEEAENALTLLLGCGCKLIDLYRGNVQDGKLAEWSPLPMIVNQNEDFYVDGDFDSYSKIVGYLSIAYMDYLDKHKPEGKMCLSNKAFLDQDWAKLLQYLKKNEI